MDIAAIIPARYQSSRMPGKPLSDIWGKPMIWWVYRQVKKARGIGQVVVATDHQEIYTACQRLQMDCLLTAPDHPTSTQRVYEAAQRIPADLYLCVNGDEPLIAPEVVERVIPAQPEFAANLMTKIRTPAEAVDETNIKVAADTRGYALFFSRSPIPHPKGSIQFDYYKHLGVLAYSPEALEFFAHTEKGPLETIEDINELRFLEHGKPIRMIPVEADSLSVDTPKDLAYVRQVIRDRQTKEAP